MKWNEKEEEEEEMCGWIDIKRVCMSMSRREI